VLGTERLEPDHVARERHDDERDLSTTVSATAPTSARLANGPRRRSDARSERIAKVPAGTA
jgi:hypothetical protein